MIKKTFSLIKKKKPLFILSSFIDLGFIIAFLSAYFIIMQKIFAILGKVSSLINLPAEDASYQALAQNLEFFVLYSELLRWMAILAIVTLIIWVIFQGVNFWLTNFFLGKTHFLKYFGKFSLFSLFYFTLFVSSFWLTLYLSFLNSKLFFPLFTQAIVTFVLIVLFVLLKYFSYISLILIRKNKIIPSFIKTFKLGVIKFQKIISPFLIMIAIVTSSLIINYILFKLNIYLFYLGFIFIFIPSITFSRILYFYKISKLI